MARKTSKTSKKETEATKESANPTRKTPAAAPPVTPAKAIEAAQDEEKKKKVQLPDTEATKLWNRIKDLPMDIFALPDQTVSMYCRYVPVDQQKVFVLIKSSAVLPALEASIRQVKLESNEIWDVEQAPPYTVISIKSKLPLSV